MAVLGFSIITDECFPDALQPANVEEIIAVAGADRTEADGHHEGRRRTTALFIVKGTDSVFKELTERMSYPAIEKEILAFWKERGIFEKSITTREGRTGIHLL